MDNRYPNMPGHRWSGPSMEAAAAIKPSVATIQAKVLAALIEAGRNGLTTVELTNSLNMDFANVQPRTTELKILGLIEASKMRRPNPSGVRATVWVAVEGRQHG